MIKGIQVTNPDKNTDKLMMWASKDNAKAIKVQYTIDPIINDAIPSMSYGSMTLKEYLSMHTLQLIGSNLHVPLLVKREMIR